VTALTVPARPGEGDATERPVPWRRMAGVTWRQHRFALLCVAVLLGVLAVYLWRAGLQVHHAYSAAATACRAASSPACASLSTALEGLDRVLANGFILQPIPVLIGAFVGAPVLARELETGTYRYAWTQGFGRRRWAIAKLVPLAVVVTLAAWLFSLLLSWFYQPFLDAGNQDLGLVGMNPFFPGLFDLHGTTFAAWTLTAFAIGALAGMLIRRVVPAIAATIAAYAALAFAAGGWLRPHYLAPLLTTSPNVPANAWLMSQWYTQHGRFAESFPPINLMNQYCQTLPASKAAKPSWATFAQCLDQHGVTQWTSYQPATRFWPFQWIESGWLLALSALLIAATVWLVRRRAA
jgi:ABC-type transport system involved in multi-copper enzyme maturation permease subunit